MRPPLVGFNKSLSEATTLRAGFSFQLYLINCLKRVSASTIKDKIATTSVARSYLFMSSGPPDIFSIKRRPANTVALHYISYKCFSIFWLFFGKNLKIPCKNRKPSAITLCFCCLYLCFAIFLTNFQKFCAKVLNNLLYLPQNSRILPFF